MTEQIPEQRERYPSGLDQTRFPSRLATNRSLTFVAVKDELVRLLGNRIVHRLSKLIRIHLAKRLESLVVFRGNEKTPWRDRQDDVRIGLDKSIGHDDRTVRGQQGVFGRIDRCVLPLERS